MNRNDYKHTILDYYNGDLMETNVMHCGDNLELMRGMDDESVDLIYADPPYFTQKDWGDFDDRFEDMDDYLGFMRPRLVEMKRILKKTGNVFIHLNYHAVHYIKVMMDGIFGYKMFKDEIVWDMCSSRHASTKLCHIHNILLVYTKTNKRTFNMDEIRIPYSQKSLDESWEEDGERFYHSKNNPRDMHPAGMPPNDIWRIPVLTGNKRELVGYQTQKPLALLERIVKMASNHGDVVLDPFMGSGTTLVAAKSLGRKYIGIDLNPDAIEITQTRLDNTAYQQELDL